MSPLLTQPWRKERERERDRISGYLKLSVVIRITSWIEKTRIEYRHLLEKKKKKESMARGKVFNSACAISYFSFLSSKNCKTVQKKSSLSHDSDSLALVASRKSSLRSLLSAHLPRTQKTFWSCHWRERKLKEREIERERGNLKRETERDAHRTHAAFGWFPHIVSEWDSFSLSRVSRV